MWSRTVRLQTMDIDLTAVDEEPTGESSRSDLNDKRREQMRTVYEWVIVVVIALTAAMLIRVYVFQQYYIDGPSMQTTLGPNDRVLVNKLSYSLHDIRRGDVIVFDRVTNEIVHDDLIKRVIALPNETVTIKSCVVFIDGQELQEPYLDQDQLSNPDLGDRCGSHSDLAAVLVPENDVFVMGDNRQQSFDSRDFGAIEESKVRGRAFVVLWPFGAWAWL